MGGKVCDIVCQWRGSYGEMGQRFIKYYYFNCYEEVNMKIIYQEEQCNLFMIYREIILYF